MEHSATSSLLRLLLKGIGKVPGLIIRIRPGSDWRRGPPAACGLAHAVVCLAGYIMHWSRPPYTYTQYVEELQAVCMSAYICIYPLDGAALCAKISQRSLSPGLNSGAPAKSATVAKSLQLMQYDWFRNF
jgi:hypothetical protein